MSAYAKAPTLFGRYLLIMSGKQISEYFSHKSVLTIHPLTYKNKIQEEIPPCFSPLFVLGYDINSPSLTNFIHHLTSNAILYLNLKGFTYHLKLLKPNFSDQIRSFFNI